MITSNSIEGCGNSEKGARDSWLWLTGAYQSCVRQAWIVVAIYLFSPGYGMTQEALSDWRLADVGTDLPLSGVAFGDGRYVVVSGWWDWSEGGIWSSADGVSWEMESFPGGTPPLSVIYANGLFVATGQSGTILTSLDGRTWTKRDSPTIQGLVNAAYGNGVFVASSGYSTTIISTNGLDWQMTRYFSGSQSFGEVVYANGWFIITGDPGSYLQSTNGIDWVLKSPMNTGHNVPIFDLAFGNERYVAVGMDGSTPMIRYSDDSVNWMSKHSTNLFRSLIFANGTFVAPGYGGSILTSYDGLNWMRRAVNTTNDFYEIGFSGRRFIAVGDRGAILLSGDIARPSLSGQRLLPGAGFLFKFTGELGRSYKLQRSRDLLNWTDLSVQTMLVPETGFFDVDGQQTGMLFYRVVSP